MPDLILPLSFILSLLAWALFAKWYLVPVFADISRVDALTPLLLLHSFRHIGLAFLLPGAAAEVLDPRFANPAAWGDFIAAVLALVALLAMRRNWPGWVALVWIFNIFGLLDLVNALVRGLTFVPTGHLGALHFIPAVIVPLLLVTHWMIFVLLVRKAIKQKVRAKRRTKAAR